VIAELKDEDLLPHLLKANPHRSTYSNMMLYLRCQVEEFAFSDKKWGSTEALDAEFEKRQALKKAKKNKKFQAKLDDLRRRTKSNLHVKRLEEAHQHTFELVKDGMVQKDVCSTCGFEVEVETF
jgi:DNA-repair protein complementing XP-A cells